MGKAGNVHFLRFCVSSLGSETIWPSARLCTILKRKYANNREVLYIDSEFVRLVKNAQKQTFCAFGQ